MNNMTGGTLPAMTWKEVMTFAHQNLELRPLLGLEGEKGPAVAANAAQGGNAQTQNPAQFMSTGTLSRRSHEVLQGLGDLFREADNSASLRTSENPLSNRVAMP